MLGGVGLRGSVLGGVGLRSLFWVYAGWGGPVLTVVGLRRLSWVWLVAGVILPYGKENIKGYNKTRKKDLSEARDTSVGCSTGTGIPHGVTVMGYTGTGTVSEFPTRGHTATHTCSVTGCLRFFSYHYFF